MEIDKIYQDLTNIDINHQKDLWDERGKGYYGEFLLFQNLYSILPGACKILMNLELPVNDTKKTEIDLLLIHETGLYVFEAKHYKGTIYGKGTDNTWTQYFRTSKNSVFKNPIFQNAYHIKILQKYFPEIPINSLIVFTNDDCELKITNYDNRIDVCKLYNLDSYLFDRIDTKTQILTMEEIDNVFNELSVYSQMNKPISTVGEEKPFSDWLKPFIKALDDEKKALKEQQKNNNELFARMQEKLKKSRILGAVLNILIAVFCVISSWLVISTMEKNYDTRLQINTEELESFKQNFLHVDQIDNEFIDELATYIVTDSVEIKPLTEDAVSFSAVLRVLTDTYNIRFQENAKYVAITKDGKVFEYDVFDKTLPFNWSSSVMGNGFNKTAKLQEKQFYGINNPNDIVHIKVVNVQVLKKDAYNTVLKSNLQLGIYSKQE